MGSEMRNRMYLRRIWGLKLWRERTFRVFGVLSLLPVLFCVVQMARPCREYQYEKPYAFEPGVPSDATVVYDDVALGPGVYRIELEYFSDGDLVGLCNVADGTVYKGGLLSNGEHMYGGLGRTGYDIWLFEGTEELQVTVGYSGDGSLVTGGLKIVETNRLWTMLLTIILSVAAVAGAALVFSRYDRAYPVSRRKKQIFFFVTLTALLSSLPYLCGYSITGGDLTYHLQRIEGVKDGLLGGQFPVRLEPKWLYGHGYADAVLYCNAFFYFPALLRLLGFTVTASYSAYCVAVNFATAWISYYCFSRILGKARIGVICCALYTLSIYRIYKLVVTAAPGEGTAMTFLPLVMLGLFRIFTEDAREKKYRTAWIPLMLGYSGLVQSHVLTCEVTALVTLLFCLVYIRKVFRLNVFVELCKGAVSTVLVSLWFLVPFLDYYVTQDLHIKHVSGRKIQEVGLYLVHNAFHFWGTGGGTASGNSGMHDSHLTGVGLVLVIALGVFLVLWFSGVFGKMEGGLVRFAKTVAVIGILLLFMSMKAFPWDRIQDMNPMAASLVSSLQFPDRFLGWGTACLTLLFGVCLRYFEECGGKYQYWMMAGAAFLGVATSSMFYLDFVNGSHVYFELYNEEGMGFGYIAGEEYLIEDTDASKLTFTGARGGAGVDILDYEKDYLRVELQCRNVAEEDSFIDLPLLLYKGYRAYDGDTGRSMQICAGDNNVVRVLVPAGFEGRVKVGFVSPVYWRVSELVSMAAMAVLAALWLRNRRKEAC